jgi:thioredoxin-like negative regulator of GroEL
MLRKTLIATCLLAATAFAQEKPKADNKPLAAQVKAAMDAKDPATALAKAEQLEASPHKDRTWADNTDKVPVLLYESGRRDEALNWLAEKTANVDSEIRELDASDAYRRKFLLARAAGRLRRLAQLDGDTRLQVQFARTALELEPESGWAFDQYARALVESGKPDEALKAMLDWSGTSHTPARMRSKRLDLLVDLDRTEAAQAEAREYLKVGDDPLRAVEAIVLLLPVDDVTRCCELSAQEVLNGIKLDLRKRTGRINRDQLAALASQLTEGGDARPLRVSDEARALAAELAGAPLADFLVPLLTGEHARAFRIAYGRARASQSDSDYIRWIKAAAGALRCHEQHYNGTALEFVKYVNNERPDNPAAALLEE